MDNSAYLVEVIAGLLYLPAALHLLRLAARTGQTPERLLGWAFACLGSSYLVYAAPIVLPLENVWLIFALLGRAAVSTGCVLVALFTRRVFCAGRPWAGAAVWGCATLMVNGLLVGALTGDIEGFSIANPGFWIEWLGQTLPILWLSAEALRQYRDARRRMRLGLADALLCNRFLLWGWFGVLQLGTWLCSLPMYFDYSQEGRFSAGMDLLVGGCEIVSLGMVWLAFTPPRLYRRWIESFDASGSRTELA
ncbi:MAG: hypothetical protein OEM49_05540 [Myxococcales bacterium]|nr:hypothetical protein [Myxococcales bacterium]MDH5567397.1 hypothetical protein [Myxococcales bacterium]